MNKGIKFRAYPNKEQQNLINQTLGCCRLIYNKGLALRNEAYDNGQKIGYVANSDYTLIDEVKSASKIKNLIKDDSQAKILFIYLDEYIIAKLL